MKIKKYLTETKRDIQDIENAVLSTMDPKKREILKNRTTELTRLSKQLEKKIAELQASGADPEALKRLNELATKIQKLLAGRTFAMSKEETDSDGAGGANGAESSLDNDSESNDAEEDREKDDDKETSLNKDTEDDQKDSTGKQSKDTDSEKTKSDRNKADSKKSDTDINGNDSNASDENSLDDNTNDESRQVGANSGINANVASKGTGSTAEDSEADNVADSADDDPVEDIFKKPENQRMQSSGSPKGVHPRLPKIDEIIKELSALPDEAKKGAIKALEDIIGNVTESLCEAIEDKALEDISDEEYGDFVNSIIDELQKAASDITVSDDINQRKLDIQAELNDKIADRDLRTELAKDATKEKRVTAQKIMANSAYGGYKPVDSFFVDLSDTIKNEITMAEVEAQSYREINPEYEGEDIIMKADVTDLQPKENKPNIAFFFDMSGSWVDDGNAVELGKRFVATLTDYVKRGELNLDVYYFSDIITNDPTDSRLGKGTHAWQEILSTIKNNDIKNVVIMTDCDMEKDATAGPTCTVEGTVWYIWKLDARWYTTGGKAMPQKLRGINGTRQYSFKTQEGAN